MVYLGISKALWDSHTPVFTYCRWLFPAAAAELRRRRRGCVAFQARHVYYLRFTAKAVPPALFCAVSTEDGCDVNWGAMVMDLCSLQLSVTLQRRAFKLHSRSSRYFLKFRIICFNILVLVPILWPLARNNGAPFPKVSYLCNTAFVKND